MELIVNCSFGKSQGRNCWDKWYSIMSINKSFSMLGRHVLGFSVVWRVGDLCNITWLSVCVFINKEFVTVFNLII